LLLVAGLEDRYGTSGTVGLALIEQGSRAWLIRLFITSCRVVTRGVGGIMMTHILESAKRRGVGLRAEFIHNDSNRMMYLTYKFHGFRKVAGHGNTVLLEHDLENIRPYPRGVTVQAPRRRSRDSRDHDRFLRIAELAQEPASHGRPLGSDD